VQRQRPGRPIDKLRVDPSGVEGRGAKPPGAFSCLILFAALLCPTAARAEIIDRILAVVEGRLIMLSDVKAVVTLGLEPPAPGADPIAAMMKRLIDRELTLIEVDRYAPPEPPESAIAPRVAALHGRFPDELAFETALVASGMTHEDLRRYVRDSLRIDSYLQQRFASAIQPSDEDVARYYREHEADFKRAGVLRPFPEVRDEARARFIAERREALVSEWLTTIRRRANVVELYLPRT
jgi:hypothetical protein